MTKILKGLPVAKEIRKEIKSKVQELGCNPILKIIIMGEDPAALYYVQSVEKNGKKVGIDVQVDRLNDSCTQKELIALIQKYNSDEKVWGIMIQKPLPNQIQEDEIVKIIDPNKDVDAFNPLNMGKLVLDKPGFLPCTAEAVLEFLKFYNIETSGKTVVVLGRSDIVGKPLINLFLRKNQTGNATIIGCHSRTKNLSEFTKQADILVAAIGKANFVDSSMIKPGSVIIDVGINQIVNENDELVYTGDVNYDDCVTKCDAITPVPGGVGTVTTACLLRNVIKKI